MHEVVDERALTDRKEDSKGSQIVIGYMLRRDFGSFFGCYDCIQQLLQLVWLEQERLEGR